MASAPVSWYARLVVLCVLILYDITLCGGDDHDDDDDYSSTGSSVERQGLEDCSSKCSYGTINVFRYEDCDSVLSNCCMNSFVASPNLVCGFLFSPDSSSGEDDKPQWSRIFNNRCEFAAFRNRAEWRYLKFLYCPYVGTPQVLPLHNPVDCSKYPVDIQRPTINGIPEDISVSTEPGQSTRVVEWKEPTAYDNSNQVPSLTSNYLPGHPFQIGTTMVKYKAEDSSGNRLSSSFTVTVTDNEKPELHGSLEQIIQEAPLGATGRVIHWPEPIITDNSGFVTTESSHQPGDTFLIGYTEVTYIATDPSANVAIFTFNVLITESEMPDMISPTVTCPENQYASVEDEEQSAIVRYPDATATDNREGIVGIIYSSESDSAFSVGTSIVKVTARDKAGNTGQCTFTITVSVIDTTPPELRCPADQSVTAVHPDWLTVVTYPTATSTDNSGDSVTITYSPESGSEFNVGAHLVIVTGTDVFGNIARCKFTVIVKEANMCTPREAPVNGALSPQDNLFAVGETLRFTCDPGYTISGTNPLTCQIDGTFDAVAPTCDPNMCTTPSAPMNGALSSQDKVFAVGATLVFTCDPGYTISGTNLLTCQTDGTFDAVAPICDPNMCTTPSAPMNGALSSQDKVFAVGATLVFTCDPGYTISGTNLLTCQTNGTFDAVAPICEPTIRTTPATSPPSRECGCSALGMSCEFSLRKSICLNATDVAEQKQCICTTPPPAFPLCSFPMRETRAPEVQPL